MASTEDPKGAETPKSDSLPENKGAAPPEGQTLPSSSDPMDAYNYTPPTKAVVVAPPPPPPPPPPPEDEDEDDEDDEGMLRMSFLGHLEELRTRIFRMLMGVGVAFLTSLTFSDRLWLFVQEPAHEALIKLGIKPPNLVALDPMDQFNIIWVKLPILASIFISSPWIIYQIWGFIAPGL